MLHRLAQFTIRNFKMILLATLVVVAIGLRALTQLPIEAYPDVTNPMVDVVAVYPGQSAEEVERKVTLELEGALAGTPRLINLHSVSVYGLSLVTLTFEDGTPDTFLRTQVSERIQSARLPNGATAELGPQATPVGQIYRYTLKGPVPIKELRAIQDWVIERRIRSVPGVADVVTFGGFEKQYQVHVDPEKLAALGISIPEVYNALQSANRNGGGGYVARGGQEFIVRGIGSLRPEDIGNVLVKATGDHPIRISDISTVVEGSTPRRGVVGRGREDEVVEGIVLLRRGENPQPVLEALKARIKELNTTVLPPGVQIVPFYDRTELVSAALTTVAHNLAEGAFLVLVVLYLFLRSFRGALIVALTIPICLLSAFIGLRALGMPANLISLGAIDFGVLVEGSVIVLEAGLYAIEQLRHGKHAVKDVQRVGAEAELQNEVVAVATASVAKPVAFALAIIFVTLAPIFSLERVEGRIFAPMAWSYVFALIGSLFCAAFVVPALERVLIPTSYEDKEPKWLAFLRDWQGRIVTWLFRRKWLAVLAYVVMLGTGSVLARDVGSEFLPELREGGFYVTMLFPSTIALEESRKVIPALRAKVLAVPEVADVMSHLGRPEGATQAEGPNNLELFIKLRPEETWRTGRTLEKVEADLRAALAVPGTQANFSQPITDRVWETISGIIGQVVIKIHGPDLGASQRAADEMKTILVQIPGVKDLATYQAGSVPQLQIDIDRERLSRRGLTVDQVQDSIEIALGGKVATDVWEGERRFSVALKVPEAIRTDIASLGRIVIGSPTDSQSTSTTLADISNVLQLEGRGAIWREDFSRFLALKFNVRGRDLGSVIAEAQAKTKNIKLPPGSYVTWGGEFENQQRAMKRLSFAVPISLAVIVLLLYLNFRSWRRPFLVMATLPLGIVGAIIGLRITHLHFSVSAAIGCVALVGQMVLGSVLSMERVIEERAHGREGEEAIRLGFARAFRPVTLASALALLGLVPLAMSKGMGAETQRPFAVAILFGGMVGVPALLLLLPIFESLAERAKGLADDMRRPRVALATLSLVILVIVLGIRSARADDITPAPAKTASAITEDKAIDLTLKINANIVASEKMIAVAQGDVIGAGLYANPRLSLSFGRAIVGQDVNGTYLATAEYGQPLYLFGQLKARTLEAEASVGQAKAEHQGEVWRRAVETRRAFARAWAAQSANEAYVDAVKDVSAIATILEARAKAGFSTDYDALRLGLERDLVKSGAADAAANLTKAYSDLVIAIGDKSLVITRVEGGEPSPTTTPPLDKLVERALASRQDLRSMRAAESVSFAAIDRVKVNAKPVPEIFVGAQYSAGPSSVAVYGGINLPLPFFDRGQGGIAHYTAEVEAKKTLSDALSKRIEVEVKTARDLLERRKTTLETFETTLATKGVALRKAAESAYSKGGLSLLELLDAYRSDRELRLRAIELKANLRDAQLDLMEALGTTAS